MSGGKEIRRLGTVDSIPENDGMQGKTEYGGNIGMRAKRSDMGKHKEKHKEKSFELLVHIGVWLLFFTWPLFIFHSGGPDFMRAYLRYIIYPLMAMGMFYLNYCFLIQRYLFSHKVFRYVVANLVFLSAAVLVMHFWQKDLMDYLYGIPDRAPHKSLVKPGFFALQNFVNLVMVVGFSVAVRMVGRLYKSEMLRQVAEKEKTQVELKNLRSQLHPHFLFNTLNNIYALITINPEKAKMAVHDMGGLLRYVLKESNQEDVPMWDEICFIRNYIALMSLRMGSGTELKVEMPEEAQAARCRIPPLLFINLVENAFKYGVGPRNSEINICLEILEDSRQIHFRCVNKIQNRDSGSIKGVDTGVGLTNLKRRLEYIYGTEFGFTAGTEGEIFVAELYIPLK